jgi:lysophospholipase L1-like esterase
MPRITLLLLLQLFALNILFAQEPRRFQPEIDAYKASSEAFAPTGDRILFTGSSTIRLWPDIKADFPQYSVMNRGFGGSFMSELLFYADTLIVPYKPDWIFIYEGDNDLASGKTAEEILASAEKLVALIQQKLPGAQICFLAPKPSLARWNLQENYLGLNLRLKEFAGRKRQVFFLDMWDLMMDPAGKPMADIFAEDGLHLNRKGYDIWKGEVAGFLKKHRVRKI